MSHRTNAQQDPVDLGIVIALKEEFREFLALSGAMEPRQDDLLTTYCSTRGSYRIATTFVGAKGETQAARVTERLIEAYQPRAIVVMGIAAGIHKDLCVGDVYVPRQVNQYLQDSKAVPKGDDAKDFDIELGGPAYGADFSLLQAVDHLEFHNAQVHGRFTRECESDFRLLIADESLREVLLGKNLVRRCVGLLVDGHLATGPVVGAAKAYSHWIRNNDRNVQALEMESAAVFCSAQARNPPIPALAIRGISDYGDERKKELDHVGDGVLRRYSMRNAVRLLWALLDAGTFPRHTPAMLLPGASATVAKEDISAPAAVFEGPGAARTAATKVQDFCGRVEEMAELERRLAESHDIVVVAGVGGIGKTSLVREFLAEKKAPTLFPAGSYWIDAADIVKDVSRIAERLGCEPKNHESIEDIMACIERVLAKQRSLLVIDNVVHGMGRKPIARGRSRTVLIARDESIRADGLDEHIPVITVNRWGLEVCREYLMLMAQHWKELPFKHFEDLSNFVGRLPLALRLVGKRLQKESPPNLLAKLRESVAAIDIAANGLDRSVAAVFEDSFQTLDNDERRALLAMGSCARDTRACVVAAVANMEEVETIGALKNLSSKHPFIEETGGECPYSLHDLVRLFVRSKPGVEEMDRAHTHYARSLLPAKNRLEMEDDEHSQASGLREYDVAELLAAVDRSLSKRQGGEAWDFFERIAKKIRRQGEVLEIIYRCERIKAMGDVDAHVRGQVLSRLGNSYKYVGRTKEAIAAMTEALSIFKNLDPHWAAKCLGNLGLLYRKRNLTEAIDCHTQALERFKTELHAAHCRPAIAEDAHGPTIIQLMTSCASQTGSLGLCYHSSDIQKAIKFHEEAQQIHEAIENRSKKADDIDRAREGQAKQIANIGLCYFQLEQYGKAIEKFQRALEIQMSRVRGGEESVAVQQNNLAGAFLKLDKAYVDLATDLCNKALKFCQDKFKPSGEAAARLTLGRCQIARDDWRKALESYEEALRIHQRIKNDDGEATAYKEIGLCYESIDPHQARSALHKALAIWDKVGTSDEGYHKKQALAALARLDHKSMTTENK